MTEKMLRTIATVLVVLTLWGCTPKDTQPTTIPTEPPTTAPTEPSTVPTEPTTEPTTAPAEPSTEPTTEPVIEPTTEPTAPSTEPTKPEVTDPPAITEPTRPSEPETLEPVTQLNSTKWVTFPELLSLGDGIVAAIRNHYVSADAKFKNTIEIIDVYQDKVLRSVTVDFTREPILQRFADRHILVADPDNGQFYEYDLELNLVSTFATPSADGWFSYDRLFYYYIWDGLLYRQELSTGTQQPVELDQDLRLHSLVSIHPTEDLLVAKFYLNAYTDQLGLAVIDLTAGTYRLIRDDWNHLWFTGDRFYATAMSTAEFGYDLYFGDLTGKTLTLLESETIGGGTANYAVLPGSHLLVRWVCPDVGDHRTELFDLTAMTEANLRTYGYTKATYGSIYLFDEDLIMGFYEKGNYFIPILMDPKAITGEKVDAIRIQRSPLVDQDAIDAYRASVDGPELEDALSDIRARADELEEKYGITILLGNQANLPAKYCGKEIIPATDLQQLSAALTVLDEQLARYPAELFAQFQNRAGEEGIVLCLTGEISGTLPTAGYTKLLRERYVLLLDVTAQEIVPTLHHELWHLLEMKISTDTFEIAGWSAQNPADFKYSGKYNTGYLDLTNWTYSAGNGAESHFLDPYSRINAREDRAQIWQAILSGQTQPFVESAYLRQKLQLITQALTTRFADVSWDPALWTLPSAS